MFIIYQIINDINGHSYVGFTSRKLKHRWSCHKSTAKIGHQGVLYRAIRKYGIDNFHIEILEEGWDPKIGLGIREPFWIATLNPKYNITKGGEGNLGLVHSEEYKRKMSLMMRSDPIRMENIRKLHKFNLGRKRGTFPKKFAEDIRKRLLGKPRPRLTCPQCGLSGGNAQIRRYHFDKCRFRESPLKNKILELRKNGLTCREISVSLDMSYGLIRKILFSNGKSPLLVTCPHCGKTGNSRGMKCSHFDKCKHRNAGTLPI